MKKANIKVNENSIKNFEEPKNKIHSESLFYLSLDSLIERKFLKYKYGFDKVYINQDKILLEDIFIFFSKNKI